MKTETMLSIAFIVLTLATVGFSVAAILVRAEFAFGAVCAAFLGAIVVAARSELP